MTSMEDSLRDLASPGKSGSDVPARSGVPEKWRPSSEVGPDGGYAISTPVKEGNLPGAEDILREHKLDPNDWIVVSARHGRWQTYDGEWLESSRINIAPARSVASAQADLDLESLVDEIKGWEFPTTTRQYSGSGSYVFIPSDQQIGKKAGDNGSEQSVRRILSGTDAGVERLHSLRAAGLRLGTVVIALPGDHVEGTTSQAGRLQGQAVADLGLTEQVRVGRRLLMQQIKAFAPLAEKVVVPVVNGNHDEVTRQVATDPSDGWNTEIASAVQDACAENPNLSHVEFRFPAKGHQTLTVNIGGTGLGLFHGHQFSGGNVEKYLSGQALGNTALGQADVWVSGHYHHYRAMDIGNKVWFQCPTTDPGSEWFRDRTGNDSKPGILTLVIGGDYDPREWAGVVPVLSS
jgi:predicted phosphodiesterase